MRAQIAARLPWAHLDRCMLLFLAGTRDPVQPLTKALPEEFRQELES